jgi:hypothetical protein
MCRLRCKVQEMPRLPVLAEEEENTSATCVLQKLEWVGQRHGASDGSGHGTTYPEEREKSGYQQNLHGLLVISIVFNVRARCQVIGALNQLASDLGFDPSSSHE